jgi:hypothetical protein
MARRYYDSAGKYQGQSVGPGGFLLRGFLWLMLFCWPLALSSLGPFRWVVFAVWAIFFASFLAHRSNKKKEGA